MTAEGAAASSYTPASAGDRWHRRPDVTWTPVPMRFGGPERNVQRRLWLSKVYDFEKQNSLFIKDLRERATCRNGRTAA